jgi:hypothetical protein
MSKIPCPAIDPFGRDGIGICARRKEADRGVQICEIRPLARDPFFEGATGLVGPPRNPGRPALAHRRLDPPGSGSRRRLRPSRRDHADQAQGVAIRQSYLWLQWLALETCARGKAIHRMGTPPDPEGSWLIARFEAQAAGRRAANQRSILSASRDRRKTPASARRATVPCGLALSAADCIGSQNHAGNLRRLNNRNRTELSLDDIAAHRRWSALDPTRTRAARPFRVLVLWGGRSEHEIEIGLK